MNKRQFRTLIAVTAVAGFLGGAASERIFSASSALAAKKPSAPKIVAAEEFRLVDAQGNTQVRIGFNPTNGLATVFWTYNGSNPNLQGKEQQFQVGGMIGLPPPPPPPPKQ